MEVTLTTQSTDSTTTRTGVSRRVALGLVGVLACAFATVMLVDTPAFAASSLSPGQTLHAGQSIAAGSYRLIMQTDGNLVEYIGNTPLFATQTAGQPGNWLAMQTDGNLVLYSSGNAPRWATNTWGLGGSYLAIQTDGNVVVYHSGAAYWAKSWTQSAAGSEAYAQLQFYHYGWASSEMTNLVNLWNRESGWRWNVCNGGGLYPNCPYTTVAYGIPQSLPGTKMASSGSDWFVDGETQVQWGENYIKGRYGDPNGAWAHEVAYGWY
jgi:hypothetical protein